jgi:hypothetical protein
LVGQAPDTEDLTITFPLAVGTHHGLRLDVLPEPLRAYKIGLSEEGNFILSLIQAELSRVPDSAENSESEIAKPLNFSDASADFSQDGYDIRQAIEPDSHEKGWAVAGAPGGFLANRVAVFTFSQPIVVDSPSELKVRLLFQSKLWKKHIISRMKIGSVSVAQPAEQFRIELAVLARLLERDTASQPVKVPILQELDAGAKRQTHVMTRGSYLAPGKAVSASTPKAFHPFPSTAPLNRLGVAQWLVDPQNPLTARVTVNRFWARIFDRGIVETEEDFGTQGTAPTHPELLDWLALDFQQDWNVKRLIKQLVMSSTFRQSSQVSAERLNKDPWNQFLSRGPRGRLTAEVVRDQALMVSGLLSSKMYGPPVYPPSPIKSVRNAFAGDFVWNTSLGEDRYRRAIYTFLKRSQPHPLFETFDVSSRQVCSFRRLNTNTPLQSFMTLNDEAFLECAQHLARKMAQHATELRQQLGFGLESALRRPADESQIDTLASLVAQVTAEYSNDISAATKIAGVAPLPTPELSDEQIVKRAGLTIAANVILNLDSFLTR